MSANNQFSRCGGFRELPELQHHNRKRYALCTACELRFAGIAPATRARRHAVARLAGRDPASGRARARQDPDGHSPTPIRLDVLDLLDMLDATARELWRCLDVIDALDWHKDPRMEDLEATLIDCAGHPRLATFADAGFYMATINGIARKIDLTLDPPEQRREIGTCELCATMLTAGAADQWVTCPVCGREQRGADGQTA